MPRLPTIGGDNNDWGNVLNEYLSVSLDTDGTIKDSALNLKTINSTSIIGSGDMAVQPTLVSGTTIKTINSTSLLGSGDIVISGGGSSVISTTTFSGNILLDKLEGRDYGVNNITTNNEITLDNTDLKDGAWAQIGLVGDGSHTPLLSAFNKWDANGYDYLNTADMLNVTVLSRLLGKNYYNIIDQYSIAASTLVSVGTSTNGLIVSFEFSREMADPSAQTGLFSFSPSKTITSASLHSGNAKIIDVAVSVAFSVLDVITTTVESGLLPAGLGDVYQGVVDQSVTNNKAIIYVNFDTIENITITNHIIAPINVAIKARGVSYTKLLDGQKLRARSNLTYFPALGLDPTNTLQDTTSFKYYIVSGGVNKWYWGGDGSQTASTETPVINDLVEFERLGTNLILRVSHNSGENWIEIHTYTGVTGDLYPIFHITENSNKEIADAQII